MSKTYLPLAPVVLSGRAYTWPAMNIWTWTFFEQMTDTQITLTTAEGNPGGIVRISHYVKSIISNDSATSYRYLYASGWRFFETHPDMLYDFSEPDFAHDDVLKRIPHHIFNPLLWLFLGGNGTGTMLHYDVLSTHAWLAVIAGRKRIALHPPANFDTCFEDKLHESSKVLNNRCEYRNWLYLEVDAGDIIFIPSRWWHVVVNEGATIGLTRNIATPDIIDKVEEAAKILKLTKLLPWLSSHLENIL